MKIKKATIKDLKEIQELNLALFKKEHKEYDKTFDCEWTFSEKGTETFKKRIEDNENSYVYIAVENGKVIGYLVGAIIKQMSYRNTGILAEGQNMYVLEEHRGKGIGSKLIEGFIKWCKIKGVKRIKLVASFQNNRAIALYRKLGFQNYDLTLEKEL